MSVRNIEVVERENGVIALCVDTTKRVGTSKVRPKLDKAGNPVGTMVNGVFVPAPAQGGNEIIANHDEFFVQVPKFGIQYKLIVMPLKQK